MRLFIAINFNKLKNDFEEIQNKIDKKLAKLKKTSTFHITLKFLGEVSEDKISLIKERLNKIEFKPFSLILDKIGVFPTENYIRIIWIGVKPQEQVKQLQENIESALKEFDFKKDFKFHPHITLARIKSVNNKEEFIKNIKDIKIEEKTVEIKNFKLVKSTLTQEGPVYEDIAIFQ